MEIIRRAAPRRKLPAFEIEPIEFDYKPITKRLVIFDTETDPFEQGLIVEPYTCGLYFTDTEEYVDFWHETPFECIHMMFRYLAKHHAKEELLILCHNFGNFDAYFMVDYFDAGHSPFIINGRLVRVMAGGQEFRDSYAMMPFALSKFDKIKFDYDKMKKDLICDIATRHMMPAREVYKEEIRLYQKYDCTSLAKLVLRWYELFGDKLTIASAGIALLRSYHGFEQLNERLDKELRPFYFGGRNQCFATGVLTGDFKLYDINSSYLNAMRNYQHPISDLPRYEPKITGRTHFAKIRAWSLGALPVRKPDGGLHFPIGTYDFFACIHEINAGLETKTLRIIQVYHSIYFDTLGDFKEFVDDVGGRRVSCKLEEDMAGSMHYKFAGNAPYGKFAQDPTKYENWLFDPDDMPTPVYCGECYELTRQSNEYTLCASCDEGVSSPHGWYLHTTRDSRSIYASPQKVRSGSFLNVATAASITSAARAVLLRGIQKAVRPVYCDTDSIICEHLEEGHGIELSPINLGAWDIEATGSTVCIAGKKLYAIFDSGGREVKKASKGVSLTASEIRRVCEGEVIEYANPVPKFKLDGTASFITRRIKRTGDV